MSLCEASLHIHWSMNDEVCEAAQLSLLIYEGSSSIIGGTQQLSVDTQLFDYATLLFAIFIQWYTRNISYSKWCSSDVVLR